MDVFTLAALLAVLLAAGFFAGWRIARRRNPPRLRYTNTPTSNDLVFIISETDHILDSYITSIQGNLNQLMEDPGKDIDRWTTSRDSISESVHLLGRHLQRLQMIRKGIDETTITIGPVNLARTIERILITLEPQATESDITLQLEVQNNQPVPGDLLIFDEIFITLLDNAIKHNPRGTEVVVELTRHDDKALVRISDTGRGISEERLSRIFEKGERKRSAGAHSGTGMGLHIAKILTEMQGGTITAESKLDEGSIFSVEFPFETQPS